MIYEFQVSYYKRGPAEKIKISEIAILKILGCA
jgi:hypothetical protein